MAALLRQLFRAPELDDFPGPFAERAVRVAEQIRDAWERTSREAAAGGRLAELHAERDDYHALIEGHIRLLGEYRNLAAHHGRAFGSSAERIDLLDRAAGVLRDLRDELFPRWRTADDLCQIMIEKLSLPADRLRALAAKSPPPQAWLDETADPFSAD